MKNEKLRVPKLRFKEFSGEWKEKGIGQVLKIGSGKDYKHLDYGNVPVYGTGGLMTYVNDYLYDGVSVCIGRKGTIDKPMLLSGEFWTVDTLFYTHSFKESIPEFIFSIFQKINWKLYNEASGVPSLSKATIEKVKVNIPKKQEQEKIASFLSSIDKKINQLSKKDELLQNYKKAMMQKIFSQKLRFKKEDGSDYPKWEEKKLCNYGRLINGLTYSPNDITENGLLVLRSSNIQNGKISFKDNVYVNIDVKDEYLTKENDILICVRNGSKRLIGKSIIIKSDIPKSTHGAFMTVFRGELNKLISHWLQTSFFFKQVHQNLGATINSINGSDLKKFKVYSPSDVEEQTKIANFLSSLDTKISQNKKVLDETQKFKKALLNQMFI